MQIKKPTSYNFLLVSGHLLIQCYVTMEKIQHESNFLCNNTNGKIPQKNSNIILNNPYSLNPYHHNERLYCKRQSFEFKEKINGNGENKLKASCTQKNDYGHNAIVNTIEKVHSCKLIYEREVTYYN
jgi:hypothetical protein